MDRLYIYIIYVSVIYIYIIFPALNNPTRVNMPVKMKRIKKDG